MRTSTKPDAIRIAAQKLFLHSGLQRTSMDAISVEANVSKQTLYRYYGSKDELFVAVLTGLTAEPVKAQVERLMPTSPLTRSELEASLLTLATGALEVLLNPTYLALLRIVIAESEGFPELAGMFRSTVIARGAGSITSLLTSEHVAPLVSIPEIAPALRLLVGPLLSYVLGALLGDPTEVRAIARAELRPIIKLFVRAISGPGSDGVAKPNPRSRVIKNR